MEPILLRRSFWTSSGVPQLISESGDVVMPKSGYAVSGDSLSMIVRTLRVLQGLPGMLLSRQVILLPLLFGNAVRVCGVVV
jgi:hypothetical protein